MTPIRKQLVTLFTGVLLISLVACAPQIPATTPPTEAPVIPTNTVGVPVTGTDLANSQWTLVSFTNTPVLAGRNLTLEFPSANEVNGNGGCNSFGGQYQAQGTTISFQQLIHTEMACTDQNLNQQEQKYLEALQTATRFEQSGDTLKIWYGTGQDFLTFARGIATEPTQVVPATTVPPTAAAPTATASSSGSASTPQRITFPAGATTAMVTGHLEPSETDAYVLRAEAGQTMTVNLTFTTGEAILIIWGADGDVLMTDHVGASSFQGVLRTTQDYNIHVRNNPDTPTDYTMTVSIPAPASNGGEQRISFAAGATTASVSGQLNASESDQYIINAAAGQTMSINLNFTEGAAILVVWGADGNVLMSDHAEASSFQMKLPTTQDYHIQVHGRPDGPTTYTMTVTIPPAQ